MNRIPKLKGSKVPGIFRKAEIDGEVLLSLPDDLDIYLQLLQENVPGGLIRLVIIEKAKILKSN